MKRRLGLLSILFVPALLATPYDASASVGDQTQVQAPRAASPSNLAGRTHKVLGLANSNDADTLRTYADDDTVAFLTGRSWQIRTTCRTSSSSTARKPVVVCRIVEKRTSPRAEPDLWWLYYRKVDGRWTAVNHRFARAASELTKRETFRVRTTRIYALAWAENWAGLRRYMGQSNIDFMKLDFAALKERGDTAPPVGEWCALTERDWRNYAGTFHCNYPATSVRDVPFVLAYYYEGGHWVASPQDAP